MIPLALLTGFLGSGKTTLLAGLLEAPALADALVIVNEFGDVGIDRDLLDASSDDTVLLANGCLCCTIRGNLVDTLGDALARVPAGRMRPFDRVIVETSGLAEPGPLLEFLHATPAFLASFRVERVITVCDGVQGRAQLARHTESVEQARLATDLVISKIDSAPAGEIAALEAELRALNPEARLWRAAHGAVDPAILAPGGAPVRAAPAGHRHEHAHGHDHDHDHGHDPAHDFTPQHPGISALSLRAETADAAATWAALEAARGPGLLRAKTLIRAEAGTLAIQLAGSQLEGPVLLPAQVDASRLVAIARDWPLDALAAALARAGWVPVQPSQSASSSALAG